jgi:hypothetical protein
MARRIDPQYVDVGLHTEADKLGIFGGMLDDDSDLDAGLMADAPWDLIPESEVNDWIRRKDEEKTGLHYVVRRPHWQKTEGTCVHNAGGNCQETVWNILYGPENFIPGSPISSYVFCAPNGRTGSSVPGSLTQLANVGQIPADTPENRVLMEKGYFQHVYRETGYGRGRADLPRGFEQSAALLRVKEFRKIDTIQKAWTMLLKYRRPFIGGRNGHCIMFIDVVLDAGRRKYVYMNTWNDWGFSLPIWGPGGEVERRTFGADSEGLMEGTTVRRGAWGAMSVVTPPWLVAI